jgi:hypothetical protein
MHSLLVALRATPSRERKSSGASNLSSASHRHRCGRARPEPRGRGCRCCRRS